MSDNNDPFEYRPPHEAAKSAEVTNEALGRYREIKREVVKDEQIKSAKSNREKQRNRLKDDYNKALEEAKALATQAFGAGVIAQRKRPMERNVTSKDIARKK